MSSSGRSHRQFVLVVDDDCDVQDALKETLEDAGYDPVCAKDGQEALAWLRRNPAPSVVLCDLFMPTMNGWNFVRHLRQDARWRTLPLVVLTAIERYWGYPTERVLRKPVGTMQLLRAIIDATNGLTAEEQVEEPVPPRTAAPVPVPSSPG